MCLLPCWLLCGKPQRHTPLQIAVGWSPRHNVERRPLPAERGAAFLILRSSDTSWRRIEGLRQRADFVDQLGVVCNAATLERQFFTRPPLSGYGDIFMQTETATLRMDASVVQFSTVSLKADHNDAWVLRVQGNQYMEALVSTVTECALFGRVLNKGDTYTDFYHNFRRRCRVPEAASPMALFSVLTRFLEPADIEDCVRSALGFLSPECALPSLFASTLVGIEAEGALLSRCDRMVPRDHTCVPSCVCPKRFLCTDRIAWAAMAVCYTMDINCETLCCISVEFNPHRVLLPVSCTM